MSKKFGICCINCQQPLNNEDNIFGTSCGHLYHSHCIHSNRGKSSICMHCEAYKPTIFQMHLTFEDAPLAGKLKEKNIEIINKLFDYERINVQLKSSYNTARRSVQQLESKVKTLKDGLQAKDAAVNELQDRVEILEALNQNLSNKFCDNLGEVNRYSNANEKISIKNDNKPSKQQYPNHETVNDKQIMSFNDVNKRNCYDKDSYNFTKMAELAQQTTNKCNDEHYKSSVANGRQQTTLLPPENEQEIFGDTLANNTVAIDNFKCYDTSLNKAKSNVIALGQRMGLRFTSQEIQDIFIFNRRPPFLTYVVEFVDNKLKTKFLEKSYLLKNVRKMKSLTIS